MFKSVKEVQDYCRENKIQMIDFKMIDLNGRWRHISIPWERFNESTMEYGIGFDGSNYGFASVEKSDMVFIPNLDSAVVDPFVKLPTISMTGDVYVIDSPANRPFDQYPRNVAAAAENYMRSEGIADQMIIGPEFEFYLFDHVSFKTDVNQVAFTIDSLQAEWNMGDNECQNFGYGVNHKAGYHCSLPQDITYDIRSEMCRTMEDWGVKVKYHHHEVGGPGQVEIEVELGPMLEMADKTMITKYVIQNTAVKNEKTATFMPKPIYGEAGNGLHVHMHLFKDGKPLFYDKDGYSQLSPMAMHFIGGLLKHAPSLCAFTNPSTNSYKRLVPGFEAPVTIGFATANRSSVIRVPAYAKAPENKRFELRNPDGTANPYYAYAAILMAGLDGIKNEIDPVKEGWGPYDFNLFALNEEEKAKIQSLPRNLEEALKALEEDHDYLTVNNVFPEKLIEIWIKNKRKELEVLNYIPNPAEFKYYYSL